jgi:hypothetical protein
MIDKFNQWVEKIGADKLLHILVAAWFVAECKSYGVAPMLLGFVVVVLLAVLKEYVLDKTGDYKDVLCSMLGGVFSILLFIVGDIVSTIL